MNPEQTTSPTKPRRFVNYPWATHDEAKSLQAKDSSGALYIFPWVTLDHATCVDTSLTLRFGAGNVLVTLTNDEIAPGRLAEDIADFRLSYLEHMPQAGVLVEVELNPEDEEEDTTLP